MEINKHKDWLRANHRTLLIGGPVFFLSCISLVYLFSGRYVSTDDAYVQAARIEISSNVAGRVTKVAVQDNHPVKKDEILFKLDNRDFVIAVKDAKAKLANAKLQVLGLKAIYRQRQAEVKAARALLEYQKRERQRQKILTTQGISSQAQLDQTDYALILAEQKLNIANQEHENSRVALANNPDIRIHQHPIVQQAQATLDQAELNLSYTIIKAPLDGIVSKVDQLQVGDYINAAQPVFALVSNEDFWIEANFKETDLTYMRPGQKVEITIDTYPGDTFYGKVVSLSPGTGASFSILPPENATGNWVKVVQRLPVRISIDNVTLKQPLHFGLSAFVEVDTHHSHMDGGD